MALYLCLNEDGTGLVSEANPIRTKHTSQGEAKEIPCYIFNDGKRIGVDNDTNPPALIYTNIELRLEGVSYSLQERVEAEGTAKTLRFNEPVEGWNLYTIIVGGRERMRITDISQDRKIVTVDRGYNADIGGAVPILEHNVGDYLIAEKRAVSLALPNPLDPAKPGVYEVAGEALKNGFEPTNLMVAMSNLEGNKSVSSSNAAVYTVGSIIKIDNEQMLVEAINGNQMTVIRGYNGTPREPHEAGKTIYCVGINDQRTHKFFIKNEPTRGLPTQKKQDVKVVIVADEEPQ